MPNIYFFFLTCIIQVFSRDHPGMKYQVADPSIADKCFSAHRCNFKHKYRTFDGSCNNIKSPIWGKVDTALVRLLPPRYADGVSSLAKSVSGQKLPNARNLSINLFDGEDNPLKYYSAALSGWGQIVTHDVSFSLPQNGNCCPNGNAIESDLCASISLSHSDPDYGQFNRTCMSVVRTRTTKSLNCKIKPVQQVSQATHFLDLSIVYGSNDKLARSLRALKGGLLKTTISHGKHYCMHAPKKLCDQRSKVCYKAGDVRINQNLDLAALQTIFLREHNRVAQELHKINPSWNDETLFQEARRIVIAEAQEITYYEFLPLVTGTMWTEDRSLPTPNADFSKYDPRVNPSTVNEFAAGCYRVLHSITPDTNDFYKDDGTIKEKVPLSDWFDRPDLIEEDMVGLATGLVRQPSQQLDYHFSDGLHKFLDKQTKPFGDDLQAIDIQRGRDHGLPSFNEVRHLCGFEKARNFSDFQDYSSTESIEKLSQFYTSVDDIDLFVGAVFENKGPLALVGPTCNCVIQEQFRRWKTGDRFWFEHEKQVGSFSQEQLNELKKSTLSRLLCDNGDVTKIQPFAFWLIFSDGNPLLPCSEIPTVSLLPWKTK